MRIIAMVFVFLCSALQLVFADNQELQALADADQLARIEARLDHKDRQRRMRVFEILATGEPLSPVDKVNAALILQHTEMRFCGEQLVSISPENHLLAHHLAKSAFQSGNQNAAFLVAQTIDRYLVVTEGRQRYGTNRLIDQVTGEEYLPEIDRNTSDTERTLYGVPSLSALLAKFPERKSTLQGDCTGH
ncbi:MAG: hypothetical protein GW763_14525 [Paraglaciecola sp.]|nr:hypothetical protein [Paraglaciecola sp.]NCT49166.1 hypothetical protein [Paraglaciecola sp.]